MKKFIKLLMIASVLPSAAIAKSIPVSNQPFRGFEVTAPEHTGKSVASRSTLGVDDAISKAPEGKVTLLSRSGKAYYSTWSGLKQANYSGIASELVECDNGDVYLKNPVSMLPTNLYIKGQRKDKTMVFELPQVAYLEPYYGNIYPYKFTNCIYCEETDTYYAVNSEDAKDHNLETVSDTFVVEILDNGTYRYTAAKNGDIMAGLVDIESDKWVGYGEILSVWEPFNATLTQAPEGLETEDVAVYSEGEGYYAKMGYDNDDVYIQGLFSNMPSAWVKGTRKGDKVVFNSGQYIGIEAQNNVFSYFVGATYDTETNRLNYNDALTFNYDDETNMLVAEEGQAAVLSAAADEIAYIEYLLYPEIHSFPSNMSYNPAAPVQIDYEYSPIYHDLCVRFIIPDTNEEGLLLDKKYIYYSFFVDDEVFVFTTADYPTFKEDMSLFPYSFTDGREIMFIDGIHEAWFYFDEPKPVGVQSFYIKDGEVLGQSSKLQTSGVRDVVSEESKVVESTEYYNSCGQRISKPSNGFYIKVTNFGDGTRTAEKSIVK